MTSDDLATTPLHSLHCELGAKMVPFAGYDMPVNYPQGIMAEHLHTRRSAGLFDVSHMGQASLAGDGACAALEALLPGDLEALPAGRIRYSQLTNERGGILDDLMVTNRGGDFLLVVNASRKAADFAHIAAHLPAGVSLTPLAERALLALQGPTAGAVLAGLAPEVAALSFMSYREIVLAGIPCWVSRSGYTGEDGFEISVPADRAEALARQLLARDGVMPVGLGARDSLRLEAGLCLYGADIDETTTPVEAGLSWSISKRRRETGGFPGHAVLAGQWRDGTARKRVGILPAGKAPARAHTVIAAPDGRPVGEVTSGGFGPSLGGPLAMGYVEAAFAKPGTSVSLLVRGRALEAAVVPMPFVPHRYRKD